MQFKHFAALLFAPTILAVPFKHAHKRQVVTETVHTVQAVATVIVAVNEENNIISTQTGGVMISTTLSASPQVAAETTASSSSITSVVATTSSSSSSSVASLSSSSSSSSASASSPSASSSSQSSSIGSGGSKGITYSPYSKSGCKDLETVKSEFKKLTGYDYIRIYATDCSQVENVLQAKSSNQKILAGIFDMSSISSSVSAIASAVENHGSWDDIYAITVGNELVNNNEASASQMVNNVATAKSLLKEHGYTGKVSTVDTFNAVISNPTLCTAGDFVAVNAHAFFDSSCSASNAGSWLKSTIAKVADACGIDSSAVLVTESGWPSKGDTNGEAVPSSENQAAAISAIKSAAGSQTFVFTAFNDYWKQPGYLNVEQYFGILD